MGLSRGRKETAKVVVCFFLYLAAENCKALALYGFCNSVWIFG